MHLRPPSEVHAPLPGAVLDRWRVLARVGSGNNGIVYRVCLVDAPEAGEFALKLAREPGDPRFEREAEMLSRIRHPHVPALRERGLWQGGWSSWYPYVVMQWVEGQRLYSWARRWGINSREAMRVLAQVARALEATHAHGTHRDVKGDNVLVTRDGHAMLVDYGCCAYEGARPLTDTPVPPGTHPYRSPQCLRYRYAHRMDLEAHYQYPPEDDVYALGVTAYYLVTGTYPPPGTDPECRDKPERPRPPPLMPPSALAPVAPELEALIMRMLREDPRERGSASELAEALEKAARSAGRAANARLQPSRSSLITESSRPSEPAGWHLACRTLRRNARPLALVGALTGIGVAIVHMPSPTVGEQSAVVPAEAEEEQEDEGVDKRAVGLADGGVDEVLAAAESFPREDILKYALALPLPKKPDPAQKRPPCSPADQRAINGVCWWVLPRKPPCDGAYDHEDGCYLPVLPRTRAPTSEDP